MQQRKSNGAKERARLKFIPNKSSELPLHSQVNEPSGNAFFYQS